LITMKRVVLLTVIIFQAIIFPIDSAKYSGDFLYLGVGGQPLALGGAFVASQGNILSGYYNPAGLSSVDYPQALFMHSETFGSLLNHDYLAYSKPVGDENNRAALGFALYRLGGGGVYITDVDQNGRYFIVSEESHADYAGYFSYGRGFSDRLNWGVTAKLIYRDIVDESAFGLGVDLGVLYSVNNWMSLGLNLQDATTTLLSYSTGTKESIYPTAKIGTRLASSSGRFTAAILADSDVRFEGRDYSAQVSAGSVSFDSHLGLEIGYSEKIYVRAGSDIGNLTLGVGVNVNRLNIDVSMRDHSEMDNTFLVSVLFRL
jgi:hypothetical protein